MCLDIVCVEGGFSQIRSQITLEQLYNCDETGLYYRSLPTETLAAQSEKQASGMKKQKDRVTLMGCNNATGTHKFPRMLWAWLPTQGVSNMSIKSLARCLLQPKECLGGL